MATLTPMGSMAACAVLVLSLQAGAQTAPALPDLAGSYTSPTNAKIPKVVVAKTPDGYALQGLQDGQEAIPMRPVIAGPLEKSSQALFQRSAKQTGLRCWAMQDGVLFQICQAPPGLTRAGGVPALAGDVFLWTGSQAMDMERASAVLVKPAVDLQGRYRESADSIRELFTIQATDSGYVIFKSKPGSGQAGTVPAEAAKLEPVRKAQLDDISQELFDTGLAQSQLACYDWGGMAYVCSARIGLTLPGAQQAMTTGVFLYAGKGGEELQKLK